MPAPSPSTYVMVMPATVPRYTISDLESLPDDGNRYELLNGVLLVTPGPAPLHQSVACRLTHRLREALPTRIADVYAPGTVEIEPNLHLEPDILVVPVSERGSGLGLETRWTAFRNWWLAVEISGRGSKIYDRDHKVPAYLAVGVREVWRVDLQDQRLYVSRPGEPAEQPCADRVAWTPPGLAEVVVDVSSLFAT